VISKELAFFKLNIEASIPQASEHLLHMLLVGGSITGKDNNIIDVREDIFA